MTEVAVPVLTFQDKMVVARKHKGLHQAELALMLGVSRSLIAKWERGTGVPDIVQAVELADALEVPLEWLVRSRCFPQAAA